MKIKTHPIKFVVLGYSNVYREIYKVFILKQNERTKINDVGFYLRKLEKVSKSNQSKQKEENAKHKTRHQ